LCSASPSPGKKREENKKRTRNNQYYSLQYGANRLRSASPFPYTKGTKNKNKRTKRKISITHCYMEQTDCVLHHLLLKKKLKKEREKISITHCLYGAHRLRSASPSRTFSWGKQRGKRGK
jgi:hypothetical protein